MGRQQPSATYRGYRTAGIRLTEELEADLAPHALPPHPEEAAGARAFDLAHVVMLAETGLVAPAAAAAMLRELSRGGEQASTTSGLHGGEVALIRALGEDVGGQIHLARSSGDVGGVRIRWATRALLLDLLDASNALREVLLRRAEEFVTAVMPGYTQGQHGQPTTFGHWLTMWACVLERDAGRLLVVYDAVNRSPAGAGIMTGTNLPIDRRRTSELLGFAEPLPHTYDANASHDTMVEVVAACATHLASASRFAGDLMLWSTSEYGFVDFPDRFCGTSSIMAQKKNPYLLEEVRSLAARSAATLSQMLTLAREPTGWPVLEWAAPHSELLTLLAEAARRGRQLAQLIDALVVHKGRMRELAGAHWAQATDVATALVRVHGISWRSAHQIVGILVRHSLAEGWAPAELTTERLERASREYFDRSLGLPPDVLAAAVDPEHFVATRTGLGMPGAAPTIAEIDRLRAGVQRHARKLRDYRDRLAVAQRRLEEAIARILASEAAATDVTAPGNAGFRDSQDSVNDSPGQSGHV